MIGSEGAEVISRLMTFLGRSVAYLYIAALVVLAVIATWGSLHPVPRETSSPVAPRHPDLLLMDLVRKVNGDASLLVMSPVTGFAMNEPIDCLMARQAVARQDVPASLLKRWDNGCAFGTMMRKATDPVFHGIATSRKLPPVAFAFDAYVEEKWHTLGLFADSDTCTRMVATAVSLGIGVRSCQPWTPRF